MPEPPDDAGVILTASDPQDATVELPAETWQTALDTASSIGWDGPTGGADGHLASADAATLGAALTATGDPTFAAAAKMLVTAGEHGAGVTVAHPPSE